MEIDNKDYTEVKIDAHIHSMYSGDGYLKHCTPQKMIKRAILAGLDAMVITDARQDLFFDEITANPKAHDLKIIKGNEEIALVEQNGKRIYVLRGMEHHDDKGHLLDLGGKARIEYNPNYSLLDRIHKAHDNSRVIGAAHPYIVAGGGISAQDMEIIRWDINFIEKFNPLSTREFNRMSAETAKKYKIPAYFFSDDHNAKPGFAYTALRVKENEDIGIFAENIKQAIREGEIAYYHGGKYVSFLEKLWVFGISDLLHGDFEEVTDRVKRAIQNYKNIKEKK